MMIPPGPVSDHVQAVLSNFPVYRDYCAGRIPRTEYTRWIETDAATVKAALGDSAGLLRLASRYPPDFDAHADEVFEALVHGGFLPGADNAAGFKEYRNTIRAAYDHGTRHTYIQPDEARLLYLISTAIRPKRMLAVGSYYGYWAVWAMPGVAAAGGEAVLIDPNREVCALAERNFRALGFADRTLVRAKKAEDVFPQIAPGIDLALLDADGGRDNPDPAYHGKGIYGFLVEGMFDRMRDGALLVVHNDYAQGPRAASLERFHAFCRDNFRAHHVAETPEGFGVYLK